MANRGGSEIAVEARDLIRRAAGDVAGKTVAAQIRQAGRHLGFAPDDWRPRELWYGRCASIAAVLNLRERYRAWSEREAAPADPADLASRVTAMRRLLTELEREVAGFEADLRKGVSKADA